MKTKLTLRYILIALLFGCSNNPPAPLEPLYRESHLDFKPWGGKSDCCQATGKNIAIASGGPRSSAAAMEIRTLGGNIVDMAVAAAFTAAVEIPYGNGIGGGGFLLVHLAGSTPTDVFLDYRETAPNAATKNMYLDKDGKVIPKASTYGAKAVATPGFVAGWYDLHKKYGKLPWRRLLQPAIRTARQGFPVYKALLTYMNSQQENLRNDPTLSKIYFDKKGALLTLGKPIIQTDLSRTLEIIANEGKRGFYQGVIGKKIVDYIKANRGILVQQDLNEYQVKFRQPLKGKWKDLTYILPSPPSTGGVMIAEMLKIIEPMNLKESSKTPTIYVHLLSEVMKQAFADRIEFIGDPDFNKNEYRALLTSEYAAAVRKRLNLKHATPSKDVRPGQGLKPKENTTHFSLMDAKGNVVSATSTLNGPFGAGVVVPGTGIILNNEMDDFSIQVGQQNMWGLVGSEVNAIVPKKRPASSMVPAIFFRKGVPVYTAGASGGSRIVSAMLQTVINQQIIYPGELRRSVFTPRMHHQWMPDKLELEDGFSDTTKANLDAMGHTLAPAPYPVRLQAIQRDANGTLTAVHDPRGEGGVAAK